MEEKKISVKQVNEREIWIEKTKVYLGDNNVVYDIGVGGSDEKYAIAVKEAILKLANLVEGKVNLFVDLTNSGKPTPEARKIYTSVTEHHKTGKVAMFGLNPVARVLASFIMGVTRKKDIHFFKTKEEALSWFKEGAK